MFTTNFYLYIFSYLLICVLISISQRLFQTQNNFLKIISIFIIIIIPIYEWFNLSYWGYYFESKIFICEFIIGFTLYYFLKKIYIEFLIKFKTYFLSIFLVIITILLTNIYCITKYIMTFP